MLKATSASSKCCTANEAIASAFEDCPQRLYDDVAHATAATMEQRCTNTAEGANCRWIDCQHVGYCAESTVDENNKRNKGCAQFMDQSLCDVFMPNCVWMHGNPDSEYTAKGGHYFDKHGAAILADYAAHSGNVLFADKYMEMLQTSPWTFIVFVSFAITFSVFCMVATLICSYRRCKQCKEWLSRGEHEEIEDVLPERTTLLETTSAETVEGLCFCE